MLAAALTFASAAQPNIVLFFCDDLGYREIGPYGQKKIPTPHLDELAADGVKLNRFYTASPVCAPSRASLMTGKHAGHSPIRGNKEVGGWEMNSGEGQFPLPAKEVTIAEKLREVGYSTACIGKWGMGGPSTEGHPNQQGFGYFFGYLCQRQAHNHYPAYLWENQFPYLLPGNSYFSAHQKLEEANPTAEDFAKYRGKQYAPDECLDKALTWIGNQKSPFFLYYSTVLPHTSLQAPEEDIAKFDFPETPFMGGNYLPSLKPRATYAAMITNIDKAVGEIREKIRKEGKEENTLFVFTSDNGTTFLGQVDAKFFRSVGELRGLKSSCYEGGIRVPFLASWPGRIRAGSTSSQVAYSADLLATFGSVAGYRAARQDGVDVLPYLEGRQQMARDLYFEFPEGQAFWAAIFDSRWKAIIPNLAKGNRKVEIYDLEADPGETKDLSGSQPGLVRRAEAFFKAEHKANRDFPLPGVDTKPKP